VNEDVKRRVGCEMAMRMRNSFYIRWIGKYRDRYRVRVWTVQFIVNQVPFLAVYIYYILRFDKNVLYICILYLAEGNKDFLLLKIYEKHA